MKSFHLLVMTFCVTTVMAFAQDVRKDKGDMALMFSYNGLTSSTANAYNGGVGAQWYMSDNMALRAGVGFGAPSITSGDGSTTISGTALSLSPGIRMNLANNSNIVGYVGGQVMFGMLSTNISVSGSTTERSTSASSLGIGVFFGAEWFPTKNVSLGMEYGLGYMRSSSSQKVGDTTTEGDTESGIYLGVPAALAVSGGDLDLTLGNVALTLSLYFN